ncbi:hypothetical protein FACS189443_1950 [Planctomycetales bacterium]|nr:hypothetical protein FACS189443_1950 [Planctomycetales bacterium]
MGQDNVMQRVSAPLHTLFTNPSPRQSEAGLSDSGLPGFGTMQSEPLTPPPLYAGSLEMLDERDSRLPYFNSPYIPSIYVDGQGYVPLKHPSVEPYIDPSVLVKPESNPAVVMIPNAEYRQLETTRLNNVSLPEERNFEPIIVSAKSGWVKTVGACEVYFLQGDCSIRQGGTAANGPSAVVWVTKEKDSFSGMREVTAFIESHSSQQPVRIELSDSQYQKNSKKEKNGKSQITDTKWLGHLQTSTSVSTLIMNQEKIPDADPAIYQRALAVLSPVIQQTQYLSIPQLSSDQQTENPVAAASAGFRQMTLNSRGDSNINIAFEAYPNEPSRGVLIVTGGLNLVIEGISGIEQNAMLAGNIVDISADNAVVWMANPSKLSNGGSHQESDKDDFEVYLEGNIEYRDGPRLIKADKMYYDAKNKVAYILNGDLSAPIIGVKDVSGSVRLKAEILRQLGDGFFTAKKTMVTTSQLGEPTYSFNSRSLTLDQRAAGSSGKSRQMLTAENNYIAVGKVPVFYYPWMAADVQDPTFYLKSLAFGNSSIDGTTVKTVWNPFQILNCRNKPDWLDGDVNVTYLSKRGLGYGTNLKYSPPSFCRIPGQANGSFTFWGLNDSGKDYLGGGRSNVSFPDPYRYRLHWVHQQQIATLGKFAGISFGGPWDFRAEVGKVSDRNFLNSYYHSEWETSENATTAVDLKKTHGNQSLGLSAEYSLDNDYSNANWFPRLDHYWMGKEFLRDTFTWYEHTRVGVMNYHTADRPYDEARDGRYFRYLPWETPGKTEQGIVFSTRNEVDLPFSVGALRVIPYVLGDFSFWGSDQQGNAQNRLYGQGGVRLNLPFWKVQPKWSSRTLYLNGLAHKIDFDGEYLYGEANKPMDNLILTDPLDTWSIDDFRRRYSVTNSFFYNYGRSTGWNNYIPRQFDPRYYAVRSGMASNVSAGNMEAADDLQLFRFGMTHRFQTKRGSVGKRHIVDWITFSTHANFYPQEDQNYGKPLGLLDYDVVWNVGDRFSLFSEGIYDFFDFGQNLTRVGGIWNRPERGSASVMLDQFKGVIERTYLTLSLGYTMNEKYGMQYSTSYDIKDNWRNVGHNFVFTRTGESFRLLVGAVYSEALSEWSFSFGLEPVFVRMKRMMMNNNTMQNH